MPPKAKFTKQEIINASIEIIETTGIETLTARNLGCKLGSSARPVFTVFDSMDDVITAAASYANELYTQYVDRGLSEPLPFKGVGENYIKFAFEHPKLFQLLFMKENERVPDMQNVLQGIESSYGKILGSIVTSYGVDYETAKTLYLHTWIYSHGIAVLIATNVCEFTEEQISDMLTAVFISLLIRAKKGELK